jgi:acyl carrier protein
VNEADLQRVILEALAEVAPEAQETKIDARVSLRDQLELDSMDFLNFMIAIERSLGVAIPEADYPRVATLAECARYVAARLPPKR